MTREYYESDSKLIIYIYIYWSLGLKAITIAFESAPCPLPVALPAGEGNVQIIHPFGPDKLANAMEIIPGVSNAFDI